MKMNNVINQYIKLVKKHLPCKLATRWVIGKEIKAAILDRFADAEEISLEMLCDEFGTPEEVANSFLESSYVGETRKRIKWINIIVTCVCIVAIAVLALGIVLIFESSSNYTYINNKL